MAIGVWAARRRRKPTTQDSRRQEGLGVERAPDLQTIGRVRKHLIIRAISSSRQAVGTQSEPRSDARISTQNLKSET